MNLAWLDRMARAGVTPDGGRPFVSRLAAKLRARAGRVPGTHSFLEVGPFRLRVPGDHDLRVILESHPLYATNLGRLAHAVARGSRTPVVVDVGANVGDSAAVMLAHAPAEILAVEGSPRFLPYLRHNLAGGLGGVELEPGWLLPGSAPLRARLMSAKGSARLVPDRAAPALRGLTLEGLLAAHPRFARPDLVKLDTDGHDGAILLGALTALRRLRPVLFFEYDPHLWHRGGGLDPAFFSSLEGAGYRRGLVWDSLGHFQGTLDLSARDALEDFRSRWSGPLDALQVQYADVALFPTGRERAFGRCRALELRFRAAAAARPGLDFAAAVELGREALTALFQPQNRRKARADSRSSPGARRRA